MCWRERKEKESDRGREVMRKNTKEYSQSAKREDFSKPSTPWKSYILLTVCLVRILGKWPTWCTVLCYVFLFQFSTCFEQPHAHHQEKQLYQYNIWYMSLCVGDRFMCRSDLVRPAHETVTNTRVTYTRCCIDTTDSPDDEHEVARNK